MTGMKCGRSSITLKNVCGIFAIFLFIFTTAVFLKEGTVKYRITKVGEYCAPLGRDEVSFTIPGVSTRPDTNPCSTPDTKPDKQTLEMFNITFTSEEKNIFKDLLTEFSKIANENMLDFFLCSGSLLGSYRHHGMIPWDDDLDIMMNYSQKKAIKAAFQLSSNLTLDASTTVRWKVYSDSSFPIKVRPWKWPFLDLSFFKESSSQLWDSDPIWAKACFHKSWIFPTVLRPFWDLWLPAPRDTARVLRREFDLDMCASSSYNHKFEHFIDYKKEIPCKSMCDRVPMVSRHAPNDSVIIETLYIGNRRLSSVTLNKP